ncbi:MAG TPA: Rieske (2Fe-2S) protein [Acidimicrobiales bacterium]|nr:Rieske (2Fe-2S) protein [Acidimicrobiales bacterium]
MTITKESSGGVDAGSVDDLRRDGKLVTKVGEHPVVVFWHDDRPYAIEDRCPHLGFPLHRGTVEAGLVTCHWHHARFDLQSGCTLDLFADDARAFDSAIEDGRVRVWARAVPDPREGLENRLSDGLEDGLDLVIAKAVLGLLEAGAAPEQIVRTGLEFGAKNRHDGWGAGMTVLVAMANLLPHLHPDDRAAALVHGLTFVSSDTRGRAPRFPLAPLGSGEVDLVRLARWYRRFIDTRSPDAAERTLATVLATHSPTDAEAVMVAAVTDHVFIDEGHTLDFTNKAMEALTHVGEEAAPLLLPTLVLQTARASREEETSPWRHPDDLAAMLRRTNERLPGLVAEGEANGVDPHYDAEALAWRVLDDDPTQVVAALEDAVAAGATGEALARAVAYAAALRITRFHTQNDFGDWNTVHHAFTAANALHQALRRGSSVELLRGVFQCGLRVYLDRFLNVPAARLPATTTGDLAHLEEGWRTQGHVDAAGATVAGYLRGGGNRADVVAALGHALLEEDAGFHWYQVVEAGVRQAHAWPEHSEPSTLILTGIARFLAAHTPTRRQLSTTISIARRLRRGEHLYEEEGAAT